MPISNSERRDAEATEVIRIWVHFGLGHFPERGYVGGDYDEIKSGEHNLWASKVLGKNDGRTDWSLGVFKG
jgi:hypothetical protein